MPLATANGILFALNGNSDNMIRTNFEFIKV